MSDVSTKHPIYQKCILAWEINDALMGGTAEMRIKGEKYLPKWPAEDAESYKARLAVATLLPTYQKTIKDNIGRIFAEPTLLSDDTPDEIKALCDDIDFNGNRLDVWAQNLASTAIQYGIAHILVDYPRVDTETVKTKADEKAMGLRPYAVIINPKQLIGFKTESINGRDVLTEIRIEENIVISEGYESKEITQIREITIGETRIHRQKADKTWEEVEKWKTNSTSIPLITLYGDSSGFMAGKPMLLDLAYLVIKHWQSQSEQDNILHVARVPLLVVYGLSEGQNLVVGASSATQFDDKQKQGLEYIEHTGASIEAGRQSLQDLEEQMKIAGAKLLKSETSSTKTINQVNEERMQEHSQLYTLANSLEDAIDKVLELMAEWLGLDFGGSVDVRTELETNGKDFNPQSAMAIQSLYQSGLIRIQDAVRFLQSDRVIDPDADLDEVVESLLNQQTLL